MAAGETGASRPTDPTQEVGLDRTHPPEASIHLYKTVSMRNNLHRVTFMPYKQSDEDSLLRPSDVKDASKTRVHEGLDLLHGGFCHSSCFRAIQQHGLDVGVEEAKLGGHADFP